MLVLNLCWFTIILWASSCDKSKTMLFYLGQINNEYFYLVWVWVHIVRVSLEKYMLLMSDEALYRKVRSTSGLVSQKRAGIAFISPTHLNGIVSSG